MTGRLYLIKARNGQAARFKPPGADYSIPNHWLFLPIKRVVETKITDGPHETPTILENGVPFLSAESVKNNSLDFSLKRGFISQEDHGAFSRKCKPQRDDIFMVKSGATTGNLAIVEVDEEFSIWSPLALIRADKTKMSPQFLFYVLLNPYFQQQVELSWSFGTQQNIGMGVIENLSVPIPPLSEQRTIVAYLERALSEMDELKVTLLDSLGLLAQRRAALIAEAVTGRLKQTTRPT